MDINQKRSELQEVYGNLWEEQGCNAAFDLSVRFGKSKLILDRIKEGEVVKIIYPYTINKKTWQKEIEKWKPKSENIQLMTFRTALKKLTGGGLLIFDEFHLAPDSLLKYLSKMRFDRRIAFSGTVERYTYKNFYYWMRMPIAGVYTLEQAIRDGLVADYRITCIPVELEKVKKEIPIKYREGVFYVTEYDSYKYWDDRFIKEKEKEDTLKKELEAYIIMSSNTLDEINYRERIAKTEQDREDVKELIKKANTINIQVQHIRNQLMDAAFAKRTFASKRMNIIYNSNSKLQVAKDEIFKSIEDRCLIFAKRADMADALSDKSYHSKNRDKEAFEDFIAGRINHLAVVDMVSVGTEIPRVSYCVVEQSDSNPSTLVQKINRITTFEWDNPGKMADIRIIYIKDTQDEVWLKSALSMFNEEKITYK